MQMDLYAGPEDSYTVESYSFLLSPSASLLFLPLGSLSLAWFS
jgi:hypothetical protein